jgi:small-conductance mechanosensitive channel
MRRLLCALLLACAALTGGVGVGGGVQAQEELSVTQMVAPDYGDWEREARMAEEVLDAGQASNEELDALRTSLAAWRGRFLDTQDINAQRIATLREQVAALGPVPEGEASEPEEIAARRSALNTALNEALAPVRTAEEAYTRANGLVAQLDQQVRDRQAERVLRFDPTPLNPVNWPKAVSALVLVGEAAGGEIINNYTSGGTRASVWRDLPYTLALVVVGLILVVRSGRWIERGLRALKARRRDGRAAFRVGTFLASIFGVILPVSGVLLLLTAVESTGLTATVGDQVIYILATIVAFLAAARWLSNQVFPRASPPQPLLNLDDRCLRRGRFYTINLGLLLALQQGIDLLADAEFLSGVLTPGVLSVLHFPVIALAGWGLYRLGQLVLDAALMPAEDAGAATSGAAARGHLVGKMLGRGAMAVAVIGPLAAAIGYVTAGGQLVFSTVLTLALCAVLGVLQRFVRDVYAMVFNDEGMDNALIPVLIGFVLVILAIPVLALIWGARLADLRESWAVVSAGVQMGETRISPADFVTFAVIFVIGYTLTRLAQNALKTQVLPKTKIDIGGRNAVVSGVGYVGIFLAGLMAITGAGIDLSSLAIVAGALSIGVGFGLQTIVSNFVSGIILLVERPISEGDWIEVGGTMGVVRDISVRATRIETFDRRDVIVPNADLISTSVTNWTKGNLTGRIIVPVGVAYGTDTRKVEGILREIAQAHPQVIVNPPPNVFFTGFGADSMDFEIRAILRDVNYVMQAPSEINHEIARRFAEEGIEIPFAQRDLWLRNPEALPGNSA